MSASDLLTEVLKLPRQQRQALAEQVWQSLDSDKDDLNEDSPSFAEELKRRVESVKSGNYESVSFQEAIAYARTKLAEARQ